MAIIALLSCGACGREPACALGTMADTAGWQVVDAGPFVFKLPPGYHDEAPMGTDSYVGTWTHGARSITFSWGPHTADPRRPPRDPSVSLCGTRINGHEAVVMESVPGPDSARRYHAGGWWKAPDSASANLYVGGSGPADDAEGRAVAVTIIRTVRLRTVWSAADSARFTGRLCEISRANTPRGGVRPADPMTDPRACPATLPPPADYERVR